MIARKRNSKQFTKVTVKEIGKRKIKAIYKLKNLYRFHSILTNIFSKNEKQLVD
jgi:hypothetical protein